MKCFKHRRLFKPLYVQGLYKPLLFDRGTVERIYKQILFVTFIIFPLTFTLNHRLVLNLIKQCFTC